MSIKCKAAMQHIKHMNYKSAIDVCVDKIESLPPAARTDFLCTALHHLDMLHCTAYDKFQMIHRLLSGTAPLKGSELREIFLPLRDTSAKPDVRFVHYTLLVLGKEEVAYDDDYRSRLLHTFHKQAKLLRLILVQCCARLALSKTVMHILDSLGALPGSNVAFSAKCYFNGVLDTFHALQLLQTRAFLGRLSFFSADDAEDVLALLVADAKRHDCAPEFPVREVFIHCRAGKVPMDGSLLRLLPVFCARHMSDTRTLVTGRIAVPELSCEAVTFLSDIGALLFMDKNVNMSDLLTSKIALEMPALVARFHLLEEPMFKELFQIALDASNRLLLKQMAPNVENPSSSVSPSSSPLVTASEIHAAVKACLDIPLGSTEGLVPKVNALLNILSAIPPLQIPQIRSALIRMPSVVDGAKQLILSTDPKDGIFWLWDRYPEFIPLQVSLCMRLHPLLNIPVVAFFLSALVGWIKLGATFINPFWLFNLESGAFTCTDKDRTKLMPAIEQETRIRRDVHNYLEWCLNDADVLECLTTRNDTTGEMHRVADLLRRDEYGTSCVQHTLLDIIGDRISPELANAIYRNFEANAHNNGVSPQALVYTHPDIFLHPPRRLPDRDDDKVDLLADAIKCNIRYQDAAVLVPKKVGIARLRPAVIIAARYGRLDILRMISHSLTLPAELTGLVTNNARADIRTGIDDELTLRDDSGQCHSAAPREKSCSTAAPLSSSRSSKTTSRDTSSVMADESVGCNCWRRYTRLEFLELVCSVGCSNMSALERLPLRDPDMSLSALLPIWSWVSRFGDALPLSAQQLSALNVFDFVDHHCAVHDEQMHTCSDFFNMLDIHLVLSVTYPEPQTNTLLKTFRNHMDNVKTWILRAHAHDIYITPRQAKRIIKYTSPSSSSSASSSSSS